MAAILADIVDCHVFRRGAVGVEFLLLQRAADAYLGGTWHPVAGRIEAGETAAEAAVRELAEETELTPLRLWQLQTVHVFYMAARDAVMLCPAFAAEVAAEGGVRLSQEHADFRWVAAAAVEGELLWPGQRAAAREIMREIVGPGRTESYLRI